MFWTQVFSHNMIPTINKHTRVTRNTATAIDNFITIRLQILNSRVELSKQANGIIFLLSLPSKHARMWLRNIMNIMFIRDTMKKNQQTYLSKNCTKQHCITLRIKKPNKAHRKFLEIFSWRYQSFFPKKRIREN